MFKCDKCGASRPQDCTCGSERPVQTEDASPDVSTPLPWAYGSHQLEIFSPKTGRTVCALPVFLNTDTRRNADYIIHAANLLPTVEAQLAEAVELLRRASVLLNDEQFGGNGFDLRCDTCDFLAKVDAP